MRRIEQLMKQFMEKDSIFKILSLDGGGIKGIYILKILIELEKRYGKVLKNFDLICGTSTGGIIALGLAIGKTPQDILDFYLQFGSKIFPATNSFLRFIYLVRQFILSNKYSNHCLRLALEEFFGDHIVKDSKCNLCIPAVNLIDAKGIVFKTYHCPDFVRDGEISLVDIALATSAAPTFFPSHSITPQLSQGLVDGGLWANNPSLIGAIEAVSYFVGPDKQYSKFSLLSLGTLSSNKAWFPQNHKKASIIRWSLRLFPLTLSVQSNAIDNIMKIASDKGLFPIKKYIRIREPYINPTQMKYIDLDNSSSKSINILLDLANSTVNEWLDKKELKEFFNHSER